MALPTRVLSLCAGYGGLDLGLRTAVPAARTVCYVEREAYVAALLAARGEEGSLDDAPIWSDLTTFDGEPWRGVVDTITGGYPCQPFSIAGRRLGTADPRHLWPHIARIVGEVRPRWCFFENVRNHLNLGLDVVRADLLSMGYRVEAGIYSAEEVGARHRRERLFILAQLDDAEGAGRGSGGGGGEWIAAAGEVRHAATHHAGGDVAHAERAGLEGRTGAELRPAGVPAPRCGEVAHTHDAGLEGRGRSLGEGADEWAARPSSPEVGLPIFAPGPAARDEWAGILGERGDLAPALPEPAFRGLADGVAGGLAFRRDQLRAGGNGVVPLQAAYAFSQLVRRFR